MSVFSYSISSLCFSVICIKKTADLSNGASKICGFLSKTALFVLNI